MELELELELETPLLFPTETEKSDFVSARVLKRCCANENPRPVCGVVRLGKRKILVSWKWAYKCI